MSLNQKLPSMTGGNPAAPAQTRLTIARQHL
jgi:hypothetical protein